MTALKEGLRDGLAAFLRTQLSTAYPTLVVNAFWPAPGQQLGALSIAVTAPGTPEVEYHAPFVDAVTPGVSPAGTATYCYGRVSVGMQLDAWAPTGANRDDLVAAVDSAINQSVLATLGNPLVFPEFDRDQGIVIPIPELLGMTFDFRFDATATLYDDNTSVHANEWRASWTGSADGYLTSQQQVVLMQSLGLSIGV